MPKSDIMTFVQRQENNIQKEDVIALYQKLARFFESDDYGQCLRNELNESYPNYLINLQKRLTKRRPWNCCCRYILFYLKTIFFSDEA